MPVRRAKNVWRPLNENIGAKHSCHSAVCINTDRFWECLYTAAPICVRHYVRGLEQMVRHLFHKTWAGTLITKAIVLCKAHPLNQTQHTSIASTAETVASGSCLLTISLSVRQAVWLDWAERWFETSWYYTSPWGSLEYYINTLLLPITNEYVRIRVCPHTWYFTGIMSIDPCFRPGHWIWNVGHAYFSER